MKIVRSIIIALIVCAFWDVYTSFADPGNYDVGVESTTPAFGVAALISTPPIPLTPMVGAGVSNWVSTYETITGGGRWIQAGWEYMPDYGVSTPRQYVEICPNWDSTLRNCGSHYVKWYDNYGGANQNWNTVYQYWVYKNDSDSSWCGSSGDPNIPGGVIQRVCSNLLHGNNAVDITIRSEAHDNQNTIDSLFDQIIYESPSNHAWYFLTTQPQISFSDLPYHYFILNPFYKMQTFRFGLYFPNIQK
jgi:hypothetical protein